MSDFQINDYLLHKECVQLAAGILQDLQDSNQGESPDSLRDYAMDRAHEAVDGHQWVIYTHKAIMLCAHCDTSLSEAWLGETGNPPDVTFGGLATHIAYGEMRARIESELSDLIDAAQEAFDAAEESDQ